MHESPWRVGDQEEQYTGTLGADMVEDHGLGTRLCTSWLQGQFRPIRAPSRCGDRKRQAGQRGEGHCQSVTL